jgi:cellulose synthase (UDP-forming)
MGEKSIRITKARKPTRNEKIIIRMMIAAGMLLMLMFCCWFFGNAEIGHPLFYWLLTFALVFKLVKMLHEWYHYLDLSVPRKPRLKHRFTADILTTYCAGEPLDMLKTTLLAMKAVRYPHTNYLCDEADDPELREFCREHGIVHVTRTVKKDAKAGNINNALKQATGELCVVLDPDHVPSPLLLDRVVPYFEDPEIGYVQIVQAYGNQEESLVARGAAEQTYHFYGPMMMCMNTYGTSQAIGANCTFRRKALDSIGGHAAGLSEDMHTAMQLHARGWKSLYVPELLTRGLVPATLPAFYKQQLKWARGTFDLLFHVYPVLFRNFTWRQKLHYLTLPFYFLAGLVCLIDILVPVLALFTAYTPWQTDIAMFAAMFTPLLLLSLLIRQYAQRWLVEEQEQGFHIAGGILRFGTWWIYLIGFVYTLLHIRVPYIPTPKNDEPKNNWTLILPNLGACLLCIAAIVYGLSIDFNPFSICMAMFAGVNALMLGTMVLIGLEKLLCDIRLKIRGRLFGSVLAPLHGMAGELKSRAFSLARMGAVIVCLFLSLGFTGYSFMESDTDTSSERVLRKTGGFYTGIAAGKGTAGQQAGEASARLGAEISLVQLPGTAGDTSQLREQLYSIYRSSALPFLRFRVGAGGEESDCAGIVKGKYDAQLKQLAAFCNSLPGPLFVEPVLGAQEHPLFRDAWQHVVLYMNNAGVYAVTWVWNAGERAEGYPGEHYADWICYRGGVSSYGQIRETLSRFGKPVLVDCSRETNPENVSFLLSSVQESAREVKGVLLAAGESLPASEGIRELLTQKPFNDSPGIKAIAYPELTPYSSRFVKGSPGSRQLVVNGKPLYIKGVAYNTSHDWRDGNTVLSRRQVCRDFERIRAMGANTIRRYDPGIYDYNVLDIAEEYNLNVLYGFWFDPKTDFYRDSAAVEEYFSKVMEKVEAFKSRKAVLAWVVGNEAWGLSKHSYAQPYLCLVRTGYVLFLQRLAEAIHTADPTRPVISASEHSWQLGPEINMLHRLAPGLDVTGINSYYEEQLSLLDNIVWKFDSVRPYLVSEFGPKGYWNPLYTSFDSDSNLVEASDEDKASLYQREWTSYIEKHRGLNVGGVAYCWHDRMEGTNTWFGITDYKDRLKPVYFALKEVWKPSPGSPQSALRKAGISAPPDVLLPGREYSFSVSTSCRSFGRLRYEWFLYDEKTCRKVESREDYSGTVSIRIPEKHTSYRLYVYVSDEASGNVVTASRLILKSTEP